MNRAAFRCLLQLSDFLEEDSEYESELVGSGKTFWLGLTRYSSKTVDELLRLVAIRDTSDTETRRYVINDVGRALIDDPSQESVLLSLLLQRKNITVRNLRIEELDDAIHQTPTRQDADDRS